MASPSLTNYKLNSKGSYVGNSGKERIGGVIRNKSRGWIVGYDKSFPSSTNNQMELLALIKRLKLVEDKRLFPLKINIDSKEIIAMLKGENLYYNALLDDCRLIIRRLGIPQVTHCYRE